MDRVATGIRHLGAVFLETDDWGRRRSSRTRAARTHHPIDWQLFFMNVRQNSAERLAAVGK